MVAVVVVVAVADGIEAVVISDMQTVAKVYDISHAFTGYAFYNLSGKAESQMFGNRLRNFHLGFDDYCRCGSGSFSWRSDGFCFRRSIR